jgi:hypothetical protein
LENRKMRWTTLNFDKHAGKSLPQIVISDPDWFFWAVGRGVFIGRLAAEAEDLVDKATAIKIHKAHPKRWRVEYRYEDDGTFLGFEFVKANSHCGRQARRLPHLDLSCVRRGKAYGKQGCRNLLRDFRRHWLGRNTATKRRCEKFFSNPKNFSSSRPSE